jgi:hypothetical protein
VLWYDFLKWLIEKTDKFPRKARFTLVTRIDDLALDIVEGIVEARYSTDKAEALRRVDLAMERLRVLLRLSHDLGYLDHRGHEHAARQMTEAGKMVGGWRRQQAERSP